MADELTDEDLFKIEIMKVIDRDLRRRYRTLEETALNTGADFFRLSRLRSGRHDQFSIGWLFRLAKQAGVRIRISVH